MSLADTTELFARTPQDKVDNGENHSAVETAGAIEPESKDSNTSNALMASRDIMTSSNQENGRAEEATIEPAAERVVTSENDLSNLDTPARPTHDHGIESNMRDTLDADVTENALFKVESLPQYQAPDLSLFESFSAPETMPASQDFSSDHALVAEPSTPTHTQGAHTASPPVVEEEASVHQAYAMLKFPDSYYYVKSVNLVITRDERFYKLYREEKKTLRRKDKAQRRAQQTLDNYAREPSHHSQYGGDDVDEALVGRPVHGLLSTYSDVGGAVSYVDPDSAFESATALLYRSRRSKNNSSSNHSIAPRSLHEFEYGDELLDEAVNDADGKALDRQEWAQVAIHPQHGPDIEKISREHLIIRYDGIRRSWVMDVIGNRVLHNGELRSRGESNIDLNHDDEIIIISVSFRFMLPIDQELEVLDSVEYDEDDEEMDDELETSPAARRMTDTIDLDSDDEGESSEEDVPLAQQHKSSKGKGKGKKPKGKEPKPKLVKLKLTNKNASKKTEVTADAAKSDDKKEKSKGKAPAKSGGKVPPKTAGKQPAKATKTTPKAEKTGEEPVAKEEPDTSKPSNEEQVVPSTEAPPTDATQALQPPQATQASPPAPINLDANSAFAGADPSQLPQKRKGPGRPPKNGLISKRDDAGVKRKVKEYERQGLALPPMNELLELVRAEQRQKDAAAKAASRGEAAPDMAMQNIDPRMQSYNVSYPSATPTQPQQTVPTGSGTPNDLPAARSTSPRPRRPAKSPSPMPAQETFSEEQLKKPTITYVFIIDEILQDPALDGQADLQTIYDKIQKRWPYFKYGTTTNGWQSSVRHNLLQCPRFVESGKSGKGKYWKINFEHELDPKKRKQVTPPPSAMPRNGSNGAPFQQAYNTSYPQGGHMHQSPYNAGAYPAAGPSGSANAPSMGQPGNGQYAQSAYGQQPNGNRPPSQQPQPSQPQPPQPFATIVQAIISYQVQFLGPHKDKPTHGPAEEQFNQALNHYSELHAGNTPPTEGKVDETQDPFKTLKDIFIRYGQGDTRGSQNDNTQSTGTAPGATAPPAPAPAAPPAQAQTQAQTHTPAAPMPTQNAAPSGANVSAPTTVPPSMQPAQPRPGAVSANGPPSITNGPQTAAQGPLQQSGPPRVVPHTMQQSQTPLAQGTSAVPPSQQNRTPAVTTSTAQAPRPAQVQAGPAPLQRGGPPTALPQGPSQPVQTVPQGTVVQPSSVARSPTGPSAPIARPPQASPSGAPIARPSVPQQPGRPVSTAPSTSTVPPVSQGPQQQSSATKLPPSVAPPQPQLPKPPVNGNISTPTHQTRPVAGIVAPSPAGAEQKPLAAGGPPSSKPPSGQQPSPAPKIVTAGSTDPTTAQMPQPRPPLPAADISASRPSVAPQPPVANLKRPAEVSSGEQEAKRLKSEAGPPASLPQPQAAAAATSPGTRPTSAGVKRSAEESSEDHEAKRARTTQESDSRVPTPSGTA
ncbi:Putative forkhead-associated (FHA) domain, Fork head domain, Fork head domain site 2 [Septoria linicola]|uniref:Forkhead-associated (FHA) domain, Fork head domain, Fork head domain site 2 n=1 Tax=Septoria linicola TaxID=215465 RepID=A0A9Q9EKE8_9PEZI|nr:putative forkhead-associated (FHA) domain, Fork head domain, Fork head domain site 2 [Septoria linicola]USW53189.1 Putative forkhead-associated (FHA) domain, Fork head domain, Fork head domain site 2 [Septoria linicola]